MGKKNKKVKSNSNTPNIAGVQNNLLKLKNDSSERVIKNVVIREDNSASREKYRLHKRDEDKVLHAVLKPGRVKVNNRGYAIVKFDDGTTGEYEITDIIIMMINLADSHINRFYLTSGAYMAAHKSLDVVSPSVDTGDANKRVDIDKMVTSLYDDHNADNYETPDRREVGICLLYEDLLANDFTSALYMWEQLKRICNLEEVTHEIIPHVINEELCAIQFVDEIIGKALKNDNQSFKYIYQLTTRDAGGIDLLMYEYTDRPFSDDEIVTMITDLYPRDKVREFMKAYGAYFLERKGFIKQLINKKYFREEELHSLINTASVFICYAETGNKDLLKYLGVNDLVSLYHMGKFDISQMPKYTTLAELLKSTISKDSKMEILMSGSGKRVYEKTETALIWELFEKDYFKPEEIKELESVRYLHVNTIIKNYFADKRRKIAAELDIIPAITDEKVLEFFTPDIVLRELESNINDEQLDFYKKDLKDIYAAANRNLEQELVNQIMTGKDENSVKEYLTCMELYNNGVLSINTLEDIDIPESIVVNDYINDKSDKKLIDFFNSGLLSQDMVIDLLDEEFDEKSFELIKQGMSARVIEGFYSTSQLITFTSDVNYAGIPVEPALTLSQLAEIKNDIVTGLDNDKRDGDNSTTLLDLYLDGTIRYSDLYDLVEAGVISKEEADEIDDHFNLDQGVAALERVGVSGQPIENLYRPEPIPGPKPTPKPRPSTRREAVGIESKYIYEFYSKIGAKSAIEIDGEECPVFDGYVIIPIIEKKIGFLEGDDGRTYILPLKIILEQINNPRGQMDLIGNATSRNDFNRDKRFVRSTNHTKNWVENTLKKAAEISTVMNDEDVKLFKRKNKELIEIVRMSYDIRKISKNK